MLSSAFELGLTLRRIINMTVQEYKEKMTEIVKQFVNAVADKEYAKLSSIMKTESFCNHGETQEEGFLYFGNWLDEQLECWEEDYGHPFVVDHFQEKSLDLNEGEIFKSGDEYLASATYSPTSNGEQLDFWFEFDIKIKEDNTLSVVFDLNI